MSRKLNNYPKFVLEHPNPPVKLNFNDIFGRSAPIHIEIGSGKGTFLVNQARCQPDADFIGIEWAGKYYRFAVDRIGRWNQTNVRIIRTDAAPYIAQCVPDSLVDCFHIYFPDPWPKKRHNKRRLITPAFAAAAARALVPGGLLRVASDHSDYWATLQGVLAAEPRLRRLDEMETGPWASGTNYELKFAASGRPVFKAAFHRTGD